MTNRSTTRVALLLFACSLVLFTQQSDAQQRRRNARRPRPTTEQPAETDAGTTEAPTGDTPAAATSAQATPSTSVTTPSTTTTSSTTTTPAAQPAATTPEPVAPEQVVDESLAAAPDLAPLRAEYAAIMDELVNARARVAIVGKALFKTKVRIIVQNRADDAQSLEKLVLRLDGAPIYRKDGAAGLEDGVQVFEGFATPGPHVLDMEADQRSRASDAFGYTLRETFRFAVQKDRLTEITIVLDDDSDMAEDFPEDGEGEYDLRTRVSAATYELEAR